MDAQKNLSDYESLAALTHQMREAALHSEWEKLLLLEQQCKQHLIRIKPQDGDEKLDEPARLRKIYLIKKILADDAEIRDHTEVWMEQLQSIMHSNRQEQRLRLSYLNEH